MRSKKGLAGIAVIAVVIISIAAFSISQTVSHPADVSVIKRENQQYYLVKGTPYFTRNLTINNINLTLYMQLITPGGNLPSDTPFLIAVNAFVVSNGDTSNHIMINVVVNHAYINQTSIPTENSHHSVINGTIYQTTYYSVSTNEPITNSTQFSAKVTVSFFDGFGPYYYSVNTINWLI